ncbi:hypothetical protein V6N13_043655 [Hibiscus sabdariffa]
MRSDIEVDLNSLRANQRFLRAAAIEIFHRRRLSCLQGAFHRAATIGESAAYRQMKCVLLNASTRPRTSTLLINNRK